MQTRPRGAESAKAYGETILSPIAESALLLVRSSCQVMIGELRGEVQAELRLVLEDVCDLCTNTTRVLDHISVCLGSITITMPSAVVSDEVALLGRDVHIITEGRDSLSNEMDLWLSRATNSLAIVRENHYFAFTSTPTSQVPKRCHALVRKNKYLFDADSAFSMYSCPSDF